MEDLTFHLEGVVKSRRDEPEDFTGPLDLILLLLSKNKIEIRDIRISELLDQYLAYLEKMRELDLDIASGFVQMAAHLMFIKTRMLLAGDKEVTEMELLVSTLEQLKCRDAYASVMAVLPALAEPLERGLRYHTRAQEPLPDRGAAFDLALQPTELLAALAPSLLRSTSRPDPKEILFHAAPPPVVYGVREKSRQLLALLRERGSMTLSGLYALCTGRSEVVATFLSVLELCTAGSLRVTRNEGGFRVSRSEALP
jgi:segregation and condensation protein A